VNNPRLLAAYNNCGLLLILGPKDYERAIAKFQTALQIDSTDVTALLNIGPCFLEMAKTKSGQEADSAFSRAYHFLSKADSLVPGYAAFDLARLQALMRT